MMKLFSTLALTSLIFTFLLVGCDNRRQGAPAAGTASPQSPAPATPGRVGGPDAGIIEGTINGGGGRGMRCKGNGRETLESLDLFEARALGLTLLPVPESEDKALDLGIELVAAHMRTPGTIEFKKYADLLKKELRSKWLTKIRYLENGNNLRMIEDSHEVIKQSGCEPVQIAVYLESAIMIDKKLWVQLDNLSKAAVWMHELLYYIERQSGRTNSISTRILVGQLFSTKGSRPRMAGIPTDEKLTVRCTLWDERRSVGSVFAYESNDDHGQGTEIVFEDLPNSTAILRKSAFFQRLTLAQLESPKEGESYDAGLDVDSLAEDRDIRIEGTKENFMFTLSSRKNLKSNSFKMECRPRTGIPRSALPAEKPAIESLPVEPPVTPKEVELKSRYDGVGTYEETATYNFRFMSHDLKVTRNNWDLLFEARKDMREDRFDVNTVTDDDSFIFDLKSGEQACEKANPCEVEKSLRHAKENAGQTETRHGPDRSVAVVKGHCYLVASRDRDGSINFIFEVKVHVKSVSAVLHKIKVMNSSNVGKCETPR